MAKKSFSNLQRGKSVKQIIDEIEVSDNVKEKVEVLEKNPDVHSVKDVVQIIERDLVITPENKSLLISTLRDQYIKLFNFENCPDSYEELKEEVKFLSGMTQYSFLLMAQRLKKIRDEKLYEKDGYPDFRKFIQGELMVSKSTVYNYIDIISFFEITPHSEEESLYYSKLIPVIPILKAAGEEIPKDKIKQHFLEEIQIKSKREIEEEARKLKEKYGLGAQKQKRSDLFYAVQNLIKNLPQKKTLDDEILIHDLIKKLYDYIDN